MTKREELPTTYSQQDLHTTIEHRIAVGARVVAAEAARIVANDLFGSGTHEQDRIAYAFEKFAKLLTPWPGFCQSCHAPLTPPDATSCRTCRADDIDD